MCTDGGKLVGINSQVDLTVICVTMKYDTLCINDLSQRQYIYRKQDKAQNRTL